MRDEVKNKFESMRVMEMEAGTIRGPVHEFVTRKPPRA